jgi:hypothetical protein
VSAAVSQGGRYADEDGEGEGEEGQGSDEGDNDTSKDYNDYSIVIII